MMKIRIVNWEDFQHYKDRDPPWIKLHNALLSNYEFRCLQDDSKLLLILLWMLRSRLQGDIPHDLDYIREMTSYKGEIDLKPLQEKGFIECYHDDSTPLSSCAPETEAETDNTTPSISPPKKKLHGKHVKLTDEQHAKLVERFGEAGAGDWIESLDLHIASKGTRYKCHYSTILNWERREKKNGKAKNRTQPGNPPANARGIRIVV